jgi:hypothetical protein
MLGKFVAETQPFSFGAIPKLHNPVLEDVFTTSHPAHQPL